MFIPNKIDSNYNQEKEVNNNILKYDVNINEEKYLIKIYPSKDNITIIFKIEKEKIQTYYYYDKFDLKDFKQKSKKFLNNENIKEVFSTLKDNVDKCSIILSNNLYKIFITLSNDNGYVADFTLRKKVISKYNLNALLINQIEFNKTGVNSLIKEMTKLDTNIESQNNIIEDINKNIININNNLMNIKSELKTIKNFTKNINKQNDKNNNQISLTKEFINKNKDKKKSFFSFENLELNKNGILKLLFGFNLITMIIAFYIWTSISKLKLELGVEKINEEEFNKKLMVINMVNELSVSSFGNIKKYIEKKKNSKEKNNEKQKRKLYEINDDLFKEEINKNHIEYKKSSITNNDNNKIKDKKFKILYDDHNQSINLLSENQRILRENEKHNKEILNENFDDLIFKISKSYYLRINMKTIIFLICIALKLF